MKNALNNHQKLKKLIKELDAANSRYPIGVMLLVERIQMISKLTRNDIEVKKRNYDIGLGIDNGMYLHLCDIIDETLKSND